MSIRFVFDGIQQVGAAVWFSPMIAEEVRLIGGMQTTLGARTVIAVLNPVFREAESRLEVEPSACHVLNLGKGAGAYFIDLGAEVPSHLPSAELADSGDRPLPMMKPGDRAFLEKISRMSPELQQAGTRILSAVRRQVPQGELRLEGKRFVERPDNFWTVTPQPREPSLAITLRGKPDRFSSSRVDVRKDRRPYSRLKVTRDSDVEEVIRIILSAKRKGM
jgi:hypothetical protein